MAHLSRRDRWVLAKLGAQRGVGAAQRVEGDAIGKRRAVFLRQQIVRLLDGAVEDAGADAVALARLVADAAGEDEVLELAPLRRNLVLAEQLHQLGVEDDLANAGGGLGDGDVENALSQIDVTPP